MPLNPIATPETTMRNDKRYKIHLAWSDGKFVDLLNDAGEIWTGNGEQAYKMIWALARTGQGIHSVTELEEGE